MMEELETTEERRRRMKREKDARYYQRHKAKKDASSRAFYEANRPAIRARHRAYKTENHERCLDLTRQWRKENRSQWLSVNAAWRKANPEKFAALCAGRRARLVQAGGRHTGEDILRIFKDQRGRCASCRASIRKGYHRDHIVPLARGGSNEARNIQLLCPPCNLSKSSKDPIDFMRAQGRLL